MPSFTKLYESLQELQVSLQNIENQGFTALDWDIALRQTQDFYLLLLQAKNQGLAPQTLETVLPQTQPPVEPQAEVELPQLAQTSKKPLFILDETPEIQAQEQTPKIEETPAVQPSSQGPKRFVLSEIPTPQVQEKLEETPQVQAIETPEIPQVEEEIPQIEEKIEAFSIENQPFMQEMPVEETPFSEFTPEETKQHQPFELENAVQEEIVPPFQEVETPVVEEKIEELPVQEVQTPVNQEFTPSMQEQNPFEQTPMEQPQVQEMPFQEVEEIVPSASGFRADLEPFFEQKQATDLLSKLSSGPISDINAAMSLNERMLYINELFQSNAGKYKMTVDKLNSFQNFEQARLFLESECFDLLQWTAPARKERVKDFVKLVRRRYAS